MAIIPDDVLRCIWCHRPVVLIIEASHDPRTGEPRERRKWKVSPQGGHTEGCADGCEIRSADLENAGIRYEFVEDEDKVNAIKQAAVIATHDIYPLRWLSLEHRVAIYQEAIEICRRLPLSLRGVLAEIAIVDEIQRPSPQLEVILKQARIRLPTQ